MKHIIVAYPIPRPGLLFSVASAEAQIRASERLICHFLTWFAIAGVLR